MNHLVRITLVVAKTIYYLTKQKKKEGHAGAMDNRAKSPGCHEKIVICISKTKELVITCTFHFFFLPLHFHLLGFTSYHPLPFIYSSLEFVDIIKLYVDRFVISDCLDLCIVIILVQSILLLIS